MKTDYNGWGEAKNGILQYNLQEQNYYRKYTPGLYAYFQRDW
jgi:hypothetical protein